MMRRMRAFQEESSRSCGRRRRGQSSVEYGLIVAVFSIVAIAGLMTLASAEGRYFRGQQQPPPAPTAIPTAVGGLHLPMVNMGCDKTVAHVGDPDIACTATVIDSGTGSAPTIGTITWTITGPGAPTTQSCDIQTVCPVGPWVLVITPDAAGNYLVRVDYFHPPAPGWQQRNFGAFPLSVLRLP